MPDVVHIMDSAWNSPVSAAAHRAAGLDRSKGHCDPESEGRMDRCPRCTAVISGDVRRCPSCGDSLLGESATIVYSSAQNSLLERLEALTSGRFKIIREIGRGAMGVVFLAEQESLGRQVAIKVLHLYLQDNPEIAQRFEREVRTQARLAHPNILTILDVSRQGGLTFFLSPYVDSISLRTHLNEQTTPPIEEVVRILTEIGSALAHAHQEGIVHRDVKPENVIVARQGHRMILTDFGIAKALMEGDALTSTRENLGTPLYMAPEQAEDPSRIDGRCDQYSLGLIGYEMLSGHKVFEAKTALEILHKQKYQQPVNIATLRPDVPPYICAAIMKAISKKPEQRFEKMEQFLAALRPPEKGDGGSAVNAIRMGFFATTIGRVLVFTVIVTAIAIAVGIVLRMVFGTE